MRDKPKNVCVGGYVHERIKIRTICYKKVNIESAKLWDEFSEHEKNQFKGIKPKMTRSYLRSHPALIATLYNNKLGSKLNFFICLIRTLSDRLLRTKR